MMLLLHDLMKCMLTDGKGERKTRQDGKAEEGRCEEAAGQRGRGTGVAKPEQVEEV